MKKLLVIILSALSLSAMAQSVSNETAKQVRLLERKIALELGKIEGSLPQINILAKQGEKAQAKALAEEALQLIDTIEADQKRLGLLDATLDEDALMLSETQETKRMLVNRINQLRYTAVYIAYDGKLFDRDYSGLLEQVQNTLSSENVAFVDSAHVSDWMINISAKAREYNKADFNGVSSYFSYVDVQTVVTKTANGKRIYENTFTEKSGSPVGFKQAAEEAYRRIAPQVGDAIKRQIQQ